METKAGRGMKWKHLRKTVYVTVKAQIEKTEVTLDFEERKVMQSHWEKLVVSSSTSPHRYRHSRDYCFWQSPSFKNLNVRASHLDV